MLRILRSIVAAGALATGLAAAATIAAPAAPASAAACGTASGVTVVVDPQQLGGGVQEVCDASGAGKVASTIFEDSGFHQSYTPNGMVCQVNGLPSGNVCGHDPQASSYWSLWWSDGTSGWVYASLGAGSLKIPAGGSVAWTWQGQSTKHQPSVAPAKKAATPTPAASIPTKSAAKPERAQQPAKAAPKPQVTPAPQVTASPSLAATPSASASAPPKKAKRTPSASASASGAAASAAAVPSPSASADSTVTGVDPAPRADAADTGGLPGWVPPAVIAVLAVVAGGIALARRRKV